MSANAVHLQPDETSAESADFTLDAAEVEKGRRAVESYLTSLRTSEARETAEDVLHGLALLFTDGLCDAYEFPWQQLRAYHVAAGMSMLKQEGVPARIETMRLERDSSYRCRQVPDAFAARDIQRFRSRLHRLLRASYSLGFMKAEQVRRAVRLPKVDGKRPPRGRTLSGGEYRALMAACDGDESPEGVRDALMFCLAYQGRLRMNELVALSLDDLGYDAKRDRVTVRIKAAKRSRGRTVALHNAALIALEDWLEWRGRDDGPLLCPVRRDGAVEERRLTPKAVRQCCAKRAEEAGLEAFSVNDLARSATSPQLVKKARGNEKPSGRSGKAWSPGASALYAEGAPTGEEPAEGEKRRSRRAQKVRFPYHKRGQVFS